MTREKLSRYLNRLLVPKYAQETVIEYAHRILDGAFLEIESPRLALTRLFRVLEEVAETTVEDNDFMSLEILAANMRGKSDLAGEALEPLVLEIAARLTIAARERHAR